MTFYGETRGRLLEGKVGEHGCFFDFIFVPEGHREAMAEFPDMQRWKFWAGPYQEFAEWYTVASCDEGTQDDSKQRYAGNDNDRSC